MGRLYPFIQLFLFPLLPCASFQGWWCSLLLAFGFDFLRSRVRGLCLFVESRSRSLWFKNLPRRVRRGRWRVWAVGCFHNGSYAEVVV